MLAADAPLSRSISTPVVLIVLVIGLVIYAFGYLRAVMHRANKDYKTVKASVPKMRKGFWQAWWAAVKIGFWVVLAGFVLVAWVVHDVRAERPVPAATVSPAPSGR
jgi:ABC-type Fe3+ transport system permease subunit